MSGNEEAVVQGVIDLPRDAIAAFCRRYRIQRLSLFGSVLRDDFRGPLRGEIFGQAEVVFEAG